MAFVALTFGLQPWQTASLDAWRRMWLEQVALWHAERQRERDQAMLEAIARILGVAKR